MYKRQVFGACWPDRDPEFTEYSIPSDGLVDITAVIGDATSFWINVQVNHGDRTSTEGYFKRGIVGANVTVRDIIQSTHESGIDYEPFGIPEF